MFECVWGRVILGHGGGVFTFSIIWDGDFEFLIIGEWGFGMFLIHGDGDLAIIMSVELP